MPHTIGRHLAVILAVGLVLSSTISPLAISAAAAQSTPSPTEAATSGGAAQENADGSTCENLVPVLSQVCDGVTGTVGTGVGAIVSGGARSALDSVVEFVVDGAGWLLGRLVGVIDRSTTPDVTAGWFRGAYGDMATIGLLGLLPFLLLSIIQGVVRQSPGQLLRATFLYVPLAAIGTGAAVVVVDMLVQITDSMSDWIGQSMGSDLANFASRLGDAVAVLGTGGGGVAGFASLLAAGAVAFASFVIWLELLLRQAAVYVAVLFLPLGFMALVWPATAHWLRRLVQGLVAIILSKFVIVAVMALAATAMDASVAEEGFGAVVAGASMLALAALAPYVLLQMIPVFEAGMSSGLEGTFRRPTAAVAPPAQMRGGAIPQMLRQRVGGAGRSAGAGRIASAGGGSKLGGAAGAGSAGLGALATGGLTAGVGLASGGAKAGGRAAGRAAAGTGEVATRSAGPASPSGPGPSAAASAGPANSTGQSGSGGAGRPQPPARRRSPSRRRGGS